MKRFTDVLLSLRSSLFACPGEQRERPGLEKSRPGLEIRAGSVGVTPTVHV